MKAQIFTIATLVTLFAATTATADNIVIGVSTYLDLSELAVTITYNSSSGLVGSCSVQPDCNNNEPLPSVTLGPRESAGTSNFFGFSPWAGFTPCTAITYANSFVCPASMNVAPPPLTPIYGWDGGGPDVQNP